jgi:hypothetical protein
MVFLERYRIDRALQQADTRNRIYETYWRYF